MAKVRKNALRKYTISKKPKYVLARINQKKQQASEPDPEVTDEAQNSESEELKVKNQK